MKNQRSQYRLLLLVLVLAGAYPALAAAKPSCPDHPSCKDDGGGDDIDKPKACPGDFPAVAFLRQNLHKNGRVIGTDVVVTNAAGSCEMVLATDERDLDEISIDGSDGNYRVAWAAESDIDDSMRGPYHPNIHYAAFSATTDSASGETSINESLPLASVKVFRSDSPYDGTGVLGIDVEQNQLVFAFEEGSREAGWFDSIRLIGDLDTCASLAQQGEVNSSCVEVVFESTLPRLALWPTLNGDNTRIFFEYVWPGFPTTEQDYQRAISFIELIDGSWSAVPKAVVSQEDRGEPYPRLYRPKGAFWDFDLNGPQRVVAYVSDQENPSTEIISLNGAGGTCNAAEPTADPDVLDSCWSNGTAELIRVGIDGHTPLWTELIAGDDSGTDLPPNLILKKSSTLFEWDPDDNVVITTLIDDPAVVDFDAINS